MILFPKARETAVVGYVPPISEGEDISPEAEDLLLEEPGTTDVSSQVSDTQEAPMELEDIPSTWGSIASPVTGTSSAAPADLGSALHSSLGLSS